MSRLVEKEFWDARHEDHAREQARGGQRSRSGLRGWLDRARTSLGAMPNEPYASYRLRSVMGRHLPARSDWSVIEIGCAPGRNLVALHRQFGYRPFGVEYSEIGVSESHDTFRRNGFPVEQVIHADVFDETFQTKWSEGFNVVVSYGFIEHFEDPAHALRAHVNLLAPGGYLVCSIPNLRGLAGMYARLFARDFVRAHNLNIMTARSFARLFEPLGLDCCFSGRIGLFGLFGMSVRHEKSMRGLIARGADRALDFANHASFAVLKGHGFEGPWSPHLLYIGRKRQSAGADQ